MEFSRQEYWSGLPFPSPGDLPDLGIEPGSPALQADALPSELLGHILNTQETCVSVCECVCVCVHCSAAAAAKSLQSCPTLCDPIDRSPPGSPAPGILQARTLE